MKGVMLTLLLNSVIVLGAINVMSTKFKRLNNNVEKLITENKTLSSKLDTVRTMQDENYRDMFIKIDDVETKEDFLIKNFGCLTDNLLDNAYEIKAELEKNKEYHLESRKVIIEDSIKELDKLHAKLVYNPPKIYIVDGGNKDVLKNI